MSAAFSKHALDRASVVPRFLKAGGQRPAAIRKYDNMIPKVHASRIMLLWLKLRLPHSTDRRRYHPSLQPNRQSISEEMHKSLCTMLGEEP